MNIHILQHIAYEYPGTILNWAEQEKFQIQITKLYERHKLPKLESFEILFILGGPMSVNDTGRYKWLPKEIEFIQSCIRSKKIIIGICLGAQLIAKALGANVYKNRVAEIGFYPIYKTFAAYKHAHFQTTLEEWPMFHWHGETFDLPLGAVNLYQSKACKHQLFIKDEHILGIQCHPEVNPELVASMLEHGKHELKDRLYIQDTNILSQHPFDYADLQKKWFSLLDYFILKK